MKELLKRLTSFPTQFFLIVIGAVLFIPFLGSVHLFDWDEVNFAESAREMILSGNYRMVQIDFRPFYEKPPLFIWMQVLSMKFFGINEFAARLPNAICGILTLLAVFNVGRSVFNSRLGVLWALLFAASLLPHIYFKSGIIDPWFNLFIFLGIFFLYKLTLHNEFEDRKTQGRNNRLHLLLSGLLIGLAVLTKGPVAILVVLLTALNYFIIHRGKLRLELGQGIAWLFIIFLVIASWLSIELWKNGMGFVHEFIAYQLKLFKTEDAGHGGPVYFHLFVLMIGCFPASALMFGALYKNDHDDFDQRLFKRWMIYLLLVVVLLFSIVQTKIIHYSSLAYFPITFLAAYYLNHLFEGKAKWNWKQTVPVLLIAVTIGVALTVGVLLIKRPDAFVNYIKDDFAVACINAPVYWSDYDLRFGIAFIVIIIMALAMIQLKQVRWAVYLILLSSTVFISTIMTFFVPRIEKHTQNAMIEFLQQKSKEDCYIRVTGFKSYAHYFYGNVQPGTEHDPNEILFGKLIKPVYIITRVTKADELRYYQPYVTELYRKNGFVFYQRYANPE